MSAYKNMSCLLLVPFAALILAGCGKTEAPAPVADEPAEVAESSEAVDPAAEIAAQEEELARREAELALQEREAELARREADVARKELESAKKAATRPATTTAATPPPAPKPAPVATPITIPAGTQFAVELTEGVNTKTSRKGDAVSGRLTTPLVIDGRTAAPAGTRVHGTVTERVSGSSEIGGTPTLGLTFNTLVLSPENTVPITGRFLQMGKSETAKDTAKIAGGAILGAVIGHQIDDDKGKVIGGILGGGAGAAAAKNTGLEVDLPAGTVIAFSLESSVQVTP